ncbi:MAG: electron transport complex subunit E [Spirochaetes bacterium]|nr:electron transport complex subunit E [Spirochaetota bacterium]
MKNFTRGIFKENPIFILLLGLCPTLAVTTKVINGIGMGVATMFVLFFANLVVSLIRGFVPAKIRIPIFIVVIASFVTIVDLVLQAFIPSMADALGIFIPLIVVNCVILGRAEAFASKNKPAASMLDGLGMAIGFMLALILLSFFREILGSGTLTLQIDLFGKSIGTIIKIPFLMKHKALVMIFPPGAFLTLGLLMGYFNSRKKEPNPNTNVYTLMTSHIAKRKSFNNGW